jgi:hypothetical protein
MLLLPQIESLSQGLLLSPAIKARKFFQRAKLDKRNQTLQVMSKSKQAGARVISQKWRRAKNPHSKVFSKNLKIKWMTPLAMLMIKELALPPLLSQTMSKSGKSTFNISLTWLIRKGDKDSSLKMKRKKKMSPLSIQTQRL